MSNSLSLAVRGRSSDGISQPRVISDHPYSPFISEIEHCREKRFRQKLYGFEGDIRWYHWFDLEDIHLLDETVISTMLYCQYKISVQIFSITLALDLSTDVPHRIARTSEYTM